VGGHRLLSAVSRAIGTRPLARFVAPIMLDSSILADSARKAEVAHDVALMTRRRDIWRAAFSFPVLCRTGAKRRGFSCCLRDRLCVG
jgi:hypothetical protein